MADFYSKDDTGQLGRTSRHSPAGATSGSQASLPKRRNFLQMAMGSAVGGLVAPAALGLLNPSSVQAQTILTPRMALRELVRGNKRFVAVRMRSFELDLAILRNHTSERQQPFAAVLACSDSRVPVELIFDQYRPNLCYTCRRKRHDFRNHRQP
jgi:carbonic anhydrase